MCAIAQCHEESLRTCAHNCTARVLVESEKKTRSKFDLLSEVIFKDLAVPAVTVKLTLGSWFILAVARGHVLLILGLGGKLCSGPQLNSTYYTHRYYATSHVAELIN